MLKPLVGEYSLALTNKNRVVVPANWREQLTSAVYYASSYSEKYIEVYPEAYWDQYYQGILSFSKFNPDLRDYLRLLLSSTFKLEADNQGRMVLPERFLNVISHNNNASEGIVIIGVGNHLEIWSTTAWQAKRKHQTKEIDNLAMRLALFEHKH